LLQTGTGITRHLFAGSIAGKASTIRRASAPQKRRWRQEFGKAAICNREGLINSSFVIPVEAGIQ